jgi:ketosteroid isomerase-like protein
MAGAARVSFLVRPKSPRPVAVETKGSVQMKIPLLSLAFVAGLVSGCVSPASGIKRDPLTALRQLDQERIQAQIGADAAVLDRIYAGDFIGVGPSGTVRTKTQVISDFTSGDLKFQSITTDEVQVRVYENTAVETGLSTMVGQDKGKAVPRDTRFTRVWVKQQGRWRLVANHYSSRIMQH